MASMISRAQLQSLDPADLAAYLHAHGWREEPSGYERASLWTNETDVGKVAEVLIPTDPSLRDFALRLSEVLWALEQVEGRPQTEILRDVIYAGADVIRLRRSSEGDTIGAIPLIDGVQLVDKAFALMTAAACSAVMPRKVVPSRRPLEAQDYLQRVKLGQTEQGSFVMTIVSHVSPQLTPGARNLLELMDEPFPRRVTKTLAEALGAAKDAIITTESSGNMGAFTKAVERGVSADLCEAVVGLLEAAGPSRGIEVDVTWALTLPATPPGRYVLEFTDDEAPVLAEAARLLRAASPLETAGITGVVTHLHRDAEADDGIVTVYSVVEGVFRRILVPLEVADYDLAIEAHRLRRGVYFVADLIPTGRQYRAANISGFRLT